MSAISNTNTKLPGTTITSPGGQTALPAASANDFSGSTNLYDKPDQTYPTMSVAHVAVFRSIGTPEDLLSQIAAEKPDPEMLDAYIQDEIMRNPEGWDQRTGQAPGTTRAGLTQLMPGQPLGGTPVTSGVAPPAFFTTDGATGGGGMGSKLLVGGAVAALGVGGFLLHKRQMVKGIEAATQALDATQIQQLGLRAPGGLSEVLGGGGADAANAALNVRGGTGTRLQDLIAHDMARLAIDGGDRDALQRAVLLDVIGRGHHAPLDEAAAVNSVMGGMGVPDPRLSRIFTAADNHGVDQRASLDAAVKFALIDKLDANGAASYLRPTTGDGGLDDVIARLAMMREAPVS